MSTIQSRAPEKKEKNHVTLTWKFPWKSCSTTHLPFLSPNPNILKACPKTFPTKMKPAKFPAKEKKLGKKSSSRVRVTNLQTFIASLRPPDSQARPPATKKKKFYRFVTLTLLLGGERSAAEWQTGRNQSPPAVRNALSGGPPHHAC